VAEKEAENGMGMETEGRTGAKAQAAGGQHAGNAPWFVTHARRLERTLANRRPLLVGVFQNAPLHVVQETVARVRLDLVQLHGSEPVEWARFVGVPVVRAFHVSASAATGDTKEVVAKADGLQDVTRPGLHAFVLLDAQRSDGLSGGSGKTLDWTRARTLVDAGKLDGRKEVGRVNGHGEDHRHNQGPKTESGEERGGKEGGKDGDDASLDTPRHARMPIILAGGLTPANVAEAIARVRPWAVDVSGGVELVDGTGKDAEKVRAFVQAVKAPVSAREAN